MAWTSPRTWVSGEILTAALLNTHLRDNLLATQDRIQVVRKSADQSITSSTTLTNDTELMFSVVAGQSYEFEVNVIVSSASSAIDIQSGFSFPTGTMSLVGYGLDSAATGTVANVRIVSVQAATSGAQLFGLGAISGNTGLLIKGTFKATASGTVRYMWTQNNNTATALTVNEGSHIKATRVSV